MAASCAAVQGARAVKRPWPAFLLRWVATNAICFSAGVWIGTNFFIGVWPIANIAIGAVIGIAQWRTLRRHIDGAGWWVPANLLDSTLGFAVGGGVIGGIIQWLVLRRQVVQAGWWILANAIGLAVIEVGTGTGLLPFA